MTVIGFDHVAIPIESVDAMLAFYRSLGFEVREVRPPLFYSVHFGEQKINLHGPDVWKSETFTLRGPSALPGCGDFCFVWNGSPAELTETLRRAGAEVIEGPVERQGGRDSGHAKGTSTYVRDPDGNLLEFILYS